MAKGSVFQRSNMFSENHLYNLPGKTSFEFLSNSVLFEVFITISIEPNGGFTQYINN